MRRKLWRIEADRVLRDGVLVARILTTAAGFAWAGLGIERTGFTSSEAILDDVKYFYRHPPRTTITFASGRKVTL